MKEKTKRTSKKKKKSTWKWLGNHLRPYFGMSSLDPDSPNKLKEVIKNTIVGIKIKFRF